MRTNEKATTLQEFKGFTVKVRYFWATDDKMIRYDEGAHLPVGWINSNVRIDLLEFTETFEELDKSMDVKVQRLYINDEFIGELFDVDLEETEHGLILKCDVIIGYN
jgi:hypothetical protein